MTLRNEKRNCWRSSCRDGGIQRKMLIVSSESIAKEYVNTLNAAYNV